jgi:hypothetical protein
MQNKGQASERRTALKGKLPRTDGGAYTYVQQSLRPPLPFPPKNIACKMTTGAYGGGISRFPSR